MAESLFSQVLSAVIADLLSRASELLFVPILANFEQLDLLSCQLWYVLT